MPSLRSALERIRGRFAPPPGGFERLVGRRRRRERNQRLAAGALALTLSGAVLAGLFWGFPRGDAPRLGGSTADALLFSREEPGGGSDLFTMNPDGSGVARLTRTPDAFEGDPAWSPDGTKIAVSLGLRDIALIDAGTLQVKRLTKDPDALDSSPSWSPDGTTIAFERSPAPRGPRDIYLMRADGTGVRPLTDDRADDLNPAWSPDGTEIAFARATRENGFELDVMELRAPDLILIAPLTSVGAGSAPQPAWSPDGTRIAFDLDGAIHVVNADGSGLTRLSPELPEETFDMDPAWSPDGTQIAFTRWRNDVLEEVGGDGDIWVMNADGTGQTQLTSGPVIDGSPTWRPTGTTIVTPEPSVDPTPTPESDDGADRIIPGAFYPTTYLEGDQIVMPITFMDGSTAEVLFAADLRAGRLGAYGFIAGGLGRVDRSINFRHGDASSFKGSGPLATYEGRGGTTVEEWEPPPDSFGCPNLVFRFGDWFVGVRTCQRELSEQEKAEWARRLSGRQTRDGFLVLEAEAPLTIAETGTHDGPQLLLQGPEEGWPFITLTPVRCDPDKPPSDEDVQVMEDSQRMSFARIGKTSYADWCEDGTMFIQVESTDQGFVEAAARGMRVRNVSLSESG